MKISIGRAKDWSSHIPMLIKTIQGSTGPVLEIGAGMYSTPIIHWLCKDLGRRIVTYENDPVFYGFARSFQCRTHIVRKVDNWDDMDFKTHWGVVLIDHVDNRRGIEAINLKDNADYIILHDSTDDGLMPDGKYRYKEIWKYFKYRYNYINSAVHTSVVSNFKDLSWLN